MRSSPWPILLPRLLTEQAAAAYLSVPRAAMKRIPAARLVIGGRLVRWDRIGLDAWLDGGAQSGFPACANQSEQPAAQAGSSEAALDRFLEGKKNAAGMS